MQEEPETPDSRRYWGISRRESLNFALRVACGGLRVVFPEPVSPSNTVTSFSRITSMIASRPV